MNPRHLFHDEVLLSATHLAHLISKLHDKSGRIYPIPRGGVPAAYAVNAWLGSGFSIVETPMEASLFVDDIYDSGATTAQWAERYPATPMYHLVCKGKPADNPGVVAGLYVDRHEWIVFPWEGTVEGSASDIVVRMLEFIGDDPKREGLLETPARVVKAWGEWFDGYGINEADIFKTFQDGAEHVDEMVIVKDIPVESFCEHHIARFHGVAHVGYIPAGKIIGLSKIARLVRMYAHRLQVQERLTNQIADSMDKHLMPKGVAVVIEAEHTCMSSRGARVHGTATITSALRGAIKDKPEARAEFFSLVRK